MDKHSNPLRRPIKKPTKREENSRKQRTVINTEHDTCGYENSHDHAGKDKPLACPFFKLDPFRYQDCILLKLPGIPQMKQHLKRRHSLNTQHCESCPQSFALQKGSDSESNCDDVCRLTDGDGVCVHKQRLLAQRVARGGSKEQWESIWLTLFPNQRFPKSIYLGTVMEEAIGVIGELCVNEVRHWTDNDIQMPTLLRILDEVERNIKQRSSKPEESRGLGRSLSIYDQGVSVNNDIRSNPDLNFFLSDINLEHLAPFFQVHPQYRNEDVLSHLNQQGPGFATCPLNSQGPAAFQDYNFQEQGPCFYQNDDFEMDDAAPFDHSQTSSWPSPASWSA